MIQGCNNTLHKPFTGLTQGQCFPILPFFCIYGKNYGVVFKNPKNHALYPLYPLYPLYLFKKIRGPDYFAASSRKDKRDLTP